jgi:sec-independent protein translocase protein TatA
MPFPSIGPLELIIILVIALLILGPGRLPEVGSSLGKSIREFRKAASDAQEATKIDVSPTSAATAPAMPTTPPQAAPAPSEPVAAAPAAPTAAEPVPPPAQPVANVLSDQAAPNEVASEPKA